LPPGEQKEICAILLKRTFKIFLTLETIIRASITLTFIFFQKIPSFSSLFIFSQKKVIVEIAAEKIPMRLPFFYVF
jgi:hypothetical protein